MDLDEVDLGPKKIVTIKNGYVGVAYVKGVLQILREGRHELNLPDERFSRVLSLQQEVVELPELDIKTTDNIQVKCHAVLNYRIRDPTKAVRPPSSHLPLTPTRSPWLRTWRRVFMSSLRSP